MNYAAKTQSDFFAADQKAETIKEKRRDLDRVERVIGLGNRVMALRGAGGYQEFVKALEDVRHSLMHALENQQGSDSGLRMVQGQVQGLSMVLRLMQNAENSLKNLALKKKKLEDDLDFLEKPASAVPGPQPS